MAMNVGSGEEAEAMSDINVTPLVDVMLVLLIIFIITIRVIIQQVPVQLPKATNLPTQTKPENITIAVDKEGGIFWNTQRLNGTDDLKSAHPRGFECAVPVRRAGARRHSADRHPQGRVHHHPRPLRTGNLGDTHDGDGSRR
jgi:hypothetical protein